MKRNLQPSTLNFQLFSKGFTLIEVMVVMAVFAIAIGFASINLLRPQTQATLDTTVTTLVADLKEQQIKAMAGDSEGVTQAGIPTAQDFGVRFETDRYILFRGTYSEQETSNFAITLEPSMQFTSTSVSIVFAKRSGEPSPSPQTVTLSNSQSGEQKTITINALGAVTIQ